MSQGRQYATAFTPLKGAGQVIVMAANVGTVIQQFHQINDAAGLITVDTLNGGEIGDELTLMLSNGANGAVITTAGNIDLDFGVFARLVVVTDFVVLKRTSATRWSVIGGRFAAIAGRASTLATNAFTVTDPSHVISGEGAMADQLDTINGSSDGQSVKILRGGQDITVGTAGNILTPLGLNFVMDTAGDFFTADYIAGAISAWRVTSISLANENAISGTLATNTFTASNKVMQINGEGAMADNIDTINGGVGGQTIKVIRGGQNVTVTQAGNIVTPLGKNFELNTAGDYFEATFDNVNAQWVVGQVVLANDNVLVTTLATDAFVVSQDVHQLNGEGAAADTLSNITGAVGGQKLRLLRGGQDITIGNAGNIVTSLGVDVVLDTAGDYVDLSFDEVNAQWVVTGVNKAQEAAARQEVTGGGAIAATSNIVSVDGAGAAADNLDNITGGSAGQRIRLVPDDAVGAPVTLRHAQGGAGQIFCPNGLDLGMNTPTDYIELYCDGTDWEVVSYNVSFAAAITNAPPSNVYVQYQRVNAADFTVTATGTPTQAINLGSALPAGAEVLDVVMETKILWTSTMTMALTALNLSVGIAGALTGIRAATDILGIAATGRGARPARGAGVAGGGAQIVANCIGAGTGPDLTDMGAGRADFYIMYVNLPVIA
jgi:hypothetical protein